ncbi:sensor histidine kinase [Halopseudomonas yangmingensis]|uniref:histidine kinase n=1 Tax=Halopseudomonas yangmingensis TaxID=1720063 RepID=A0A1I4RX11_9GAMM|nr:sensor histidine kinase [Halopseudomonas yangmingensis]SFM56757.1 Signal transduction histidine kinase [Halopseudomonas yangmingensis]
MRRGWPRSLGLRLLLGSLLWVLLAIALSALLLSWLFEQHLTRQLDAELDRHLHQLIASLEQPADGPLQLRRELSDPRFSRPYSGLYWQLDSLPEHAGLPAVQLRSRSLWDITLPVPDGSGIAPGSPVSQSLPGPQQTQLYARALHATPVRPEQPALLLRVAADQALLDQPLRQFNRVLLASLASLAGGLLLAIFIQLRLALRPLARLRSELRAVHGGQRQQLLGDYPSELQPLVDEFNQVLQDNTASIERARTLAGNLAHALKTPLSVMHNAAQANDSPLAQLFRKQLAQTRQQIDHQLARARVAAALRSPGQRTAVEPVLQSLLRVMRALHAERALQLELQPPSDELAFRGESQDLQEMLGNLLDNACKWASQRVQVSAHAAQGQLQVEIDDDGPGIAEAALEKVMQRGIRADERTPGSGLGLSIVNELAQMYQGRLQLQRSPLGGLRASLRLPLASD